MPGTLRRGGPRKAVGLLIVSLLIVGACSADGESVVAPVVDRQVEAESSREWMLGMAECLTEAGFPSTVEAEDELSVDHSPEQVQQLDGVTRQCAESLGGWPQVEPFSEEELGRLYDANVQKVLGCLREHGYDPAPPPSREKFISDYQDYQAGQRVIPWSPFLDLDPSVSSQALESCPQAGIQDL